MLEDAHRPEVMCERIEELEVRLATALAYSVPSDWAGLMAILDQFYPEETFPTLDDDEQRDQGPRIVSLLRRIDDLEKRIADIAQDRDERLAGIRRDYEQLGKRSYELEVQLGQARADADEQRLQRIKADREMKHLRRNLDDTDTYATGLLERLSVGSVVRRNQVIYERIPMQHGVSGWRFINDDGRAETTTSYLLAAANRRFLIEVLYAAPDH